ncbi:hypothetical protein BN1708_010420 [Verticillium longisporum]|uniref:Anaphase-promoting complex subunit 4 WD40 domain-containing protein n=1 Tax=Verticillium longisporum TaxID=100787 RepID=A0A0G4KRD0_VERLO|nr:Telomerase Cajal body protein 1 like [Verticillium longisporum]CRK12277.1 hypothetical protein BN1708_010420 [Verticillium longisporum]
MTPPHNVESGIANKNGQFLDQDLLDAARGLDSKPAIDVVAATAPHERNESQEQPSFYRGARWTADGTTIVASTSDNRVSAFVLPENLLEPNDEAHQLGSQSTLHLSEPSYALAPAPFFSLSESASQTVLTSCKDHPIQLHHLFPDEGTQSRLASYKLIRRETEEYISAETLLWSWPGTHFLVGSTNRLDYFDVSRTGSDGPILTIPTIPSKRHISKGGGVGMKGMISALSSQSPAISEAPIIAAGTWTRWLGLYDVSRSNKAIANWSVRGVVNDEFGCKDDGRGIVQTIWSPCGRYLTINERQASSILVYDVRGSRQPVSVLIGRDGATQQRLSCDVFAASTSHGGFEVWAGSKDGHVYVWEDVGSQQGVLDTSWRFQAHNSPIGSTILHPSGSVVATCSGAWAPISDEELDEGLGSRDERQLPTISSTRSTSDCSIKIWAIGMKATGGGDDGCHQIDTPRQNHQQHHAEQHEQV